MKIIKKIGCFVVLGLNLIGCSTLSSTDDQDLQRIIMERLNQDNLVRRQMLNVTVQEGVVILRGVVNDETVRMRAVSIVQGTPGVQKKIQDQTVRR
ncbi:MAG: BON domain-containing protein [Verrucomicrobia bacterium]|nr:MAG: BON domain-containing protein [Verrucomicrobiota bacterium]